MHLYETDIVSALAATASRWEDEGMTGGWIRDRNPGERRHSLLCLGVGLCLAALAAGGCARDSQSVAVRSASAAPAPDPAPDPAPPAKATPKPDVVDLDACQRARSDLKKLEHQAAVGCERDDQCLLDADCLVRTSDADTGPIMEARMAMEAVCSRGAVERLSCVESPARCDSGRCVARPQGR
jgi:hypothetical protein